MATRITNQKLSKSSRDWMREHLDDPYVKKAQKEGFVFSKLNDWLPGLVNEIAKQYN